MKYRCHDIRRGHALDWQASGKICARANPCIYICKLVAGTSSRKVPRVTRSWQQENGSPLPFLDYMDKAKMESDLFDQAHLGDCLDSDDDE